MKEKFVGTSIEFKVAPSVQDVITGTDAQIDFGDGCVIEGILEVSTDPNAELQITLLDCRKVEG
jgi:hypothetical protein